MLIEFLVDLTLEISTIPANFDTCNENLNTLGTQPIQKEEFARKKAKFE